MWFSALPVPLVFYCCLLSPETRLCHSVFRAQAANGSRGDANNLKQKGNLAEIMQDRIGQKDTVRTDNYWGALQDFFHNNDNDKGAFADFVRTNFSILNYSLF